MCIRDSSTSDEGGVNIYNGIAWSRGEVLETIEFSVDGGSTWEEVYYEPVNGTLSTYESFEFSFSVNLDTLPAGYTMILVRGVDSSGASSMIDWDSVIGGGQMMTLSDASSLGRVLFLSVVGLAVAIFGVWVFVNQRVTEPFALIVPPEGTEEIPLAIEDGILDAEII